MHRSYLVAHKLASRLTSFHSIQVAFCDRARPQRTLRREHKCAGATETTRSGPSRPPELSQHGARAFYVGDIGSGRWKMVCLSVMFVARSVPHAPHLFFEPVSSVRYGVGLSFTLQLHSVCRLSCLTAHICWANLSTRTAATCTRQTELKPHETPWGSAGSRMSRDNTGAGMPREANASLAVVGIKGTAAPWSATPRKHRPQRPSCPRGQARSPHCA